MIEKKQIYIGGQWVESTGREVLTVINPVTEEPLATVPRGTAEDVDRAAKAAAAAFPAWRTTSIDERVAIFQRLADITERRADEITRTIVSEVGYPAKLAHKAQTLGVWMNCVSSPNACPRFNGWNRSATPACGVSPRACWAPSRPGTARCAR